MDFWLTKPIRNGVAYTLTRRLTITGYTLVDSIRKICGGDSTFDTAMDLRKVPNAD